MIHPSTHQDHLDSLAATPGDDRGAGLADVAQPQPTANEPPPGPRRRILGGVNRPDGTARQRASGDDPTYAAARARMVETQLRGRGIAAPRVLAAMAAVPREMFVPVALRDRAYADEALPIEHGQTISQPFMVGLMTELLAPEPGDRVLDVGTGSGYQAAVLAAMGCRVTSVERVPELAATARARLAGLGFGDLVEVRVGDGSAGGPVAAAEPGRTGGLLSAGEPLSAGGPSAAAWPRIIVAAAAPDVPEALLARLADGGRLVIPVGGRDVQVLVLVERDGAKLHTTRHGACIFVPLLGEGGFS